MAQKKARIALPIVVGIAALGVIGSFLPNGTDQQPSGEPEYQYSETAENTAEPSTIWELEPESIQSKESVEPESPVEPSPAVSSSSEESAEPVSQSVPDTSPDVQPEQESVPSAEPAPVKSPEASAADPEQAFRDKLNQYRYVGSSESDKYHTPSCRWTSKINDDNLVHFDSAEEAAAAGYSPCGTCHPK